MLPQRQVGEAEGWGEAEGAVRTPALQAAPLAEAEAEAGEGEGVRGSPGARGRAALGLAVLGRRPPSWMIFLTASINES